jgi:hypothetical protein
LGFAWAYPIVEDPSEHGMFQVHIERHPLEKKLLSHLYIQVHGVPGDSKDLLLVYDIMHRIYREVLSPKARNIDELHIFMIDLLILTHQHRGSGLKIDIMDFIWNEIQWALAYQKNPPFAPYLMHLICTRWTSESGSDLLTLDGIDLSPHLVKELRNKKHAKPRYGPGAVEEE